MIAALTPLLQTEGELHTLPPGQKIVAVAVAVCMVVAVLELVRRRKLREEYSVIWVGTAAVLMALALEPRLLTMFQLAIGAKLPTSALFFGALVFLMLVSILMSIRLSKLAIRNKALGRHAAMAERELDDLRSELTELRKRVGELERKKAGKDAGVA